MPFVNADVQISLLCGALLWVLWQTSGGPPYFSLCQRWYFSLPFSVSGVAPVFGQGVGAVTQWSIPADKVLSDRSHLDTCSQGIHLAWGSHVPLPCQAVEVRPALTSLTLPCGPSSTSQSPAFQLLQIKRRHQALRPVTLSSSPRTPRLLLWR